MSISSLLLFRSGDKLESPVTLPAGRARLATKPAPTGSPPLVITIGIVVVAFFAANAVKQAVTSGATVVILDTAGRLNIDEMKMDELRGITVKGDLVRVGALTTYTELIESKVINKRLPMLVADARETKVPPVAKSGNADAISRS